MSRPRPVIAIDGPAGVGKSTTSRELARRLGLPIPITVLGSGTQAPTAIGGKNLARFDVRVAGSPLRRVGASPGRRVAGTMSAS